MKNIFSTFFTSSDKTASVTFGNFNTPANGNTQDTLCIADIEKEFHLKQIIRYPTHSCGNILDHIYISQTPNSFEVVDRGVIKEPKSSSDHHIISCTLSFPPSQDSSWCNKTSGSSNANWHMDSFEMRRLHERLPFTLKSDKRPGDNILYLI